MPLKLSQLYIELHLRDERCSFMDICELLIGFLSVLFYQDDKHNCFNLI